MKNWLLFSPSISPDVVPLLVLVLILVGAGGVELNAQDPRVPWGWHLEVGEGATEVVMIFISASNVPANATAELGSLVYEAKYRLAEAARDRDMKFAAIGVSLDVDPEEGIEYLISGTARRYPYYPEQDFGPWDEIHTGRSWYNDVSIRRIFRSEKGPTDMPTTGIPQVLIIQRSLHRGQRDIRFGEDEILVRLVGPPALRDWLDAGELLPQS